MNVLLNIKNKLLHIEGKVDVPDAGCTLLQPSSLRTYTVHYLTKTRTLTFL